MQINFRHVAIIQWNSSLSSALYRLRSDVNPFREKGIINRGMTKCAFFEWDINKAKKNLKIHGISFDEASTAFKDTLSVTIHDPLHSMKKTD